MCLVKKKKEKKTEITCTNSFRRYLMNSFKRSTYLYQQIKMYRISATIACYNPVVSIIELDDCVPIAYWFSYWQLIESAIQQQQQQSRR